MARENAYQTVNGIKHARAAEADEGHQDDLGIRA